MYYILFNSKAGGNTGEEKARKLDELLAGEQLNYISVLDIKDYKEFLAGLRDEDKIVIVGGDGSLNYFVNDIRGAELKNQVFFFAGGTGNDFLNDLGEDPEHGPYDITKYLKNLPSVTVNGEDWLFINGVGYGIDGYCCEVADQMHAAGETNVNYASIAIKGLLGKFKPRNATITVDGKEYKFRKVWIAATMNGRYYGGGMNNAPKQDRLNPEGKLSLVVFHGSGKIKTLMIFPSIFKGEHVLHTKQVAVMEGHDITVEFDGPCALQIDGETVLAVTKYQAKSWNKK
ncbi:MAG: hypothetical protein IKP61_11645 [Spirochaetales bacterium]|nr:hypothetical protein [Spirochaetales bacterium]